MVRNAFLAPVQPFETGRHHGGAVDGIVKLRAGGKHLQRQLGHRDDVKAYFPRSGRDLWAQVALKIGKTGAVQKRYLLGMGQHPGVKKRILKKMRVGKTKVMRAQHRAAHHLVGGLRFQQLGQMDRLQSLSRVRACRSVANQRPDRVKLAAVIKRLQMPPHVRHRAFAKNQIRIIAQNNVSNGLKSPGRAGIIGIQKTHIIAGHLLQGLVAGTAQTVVGLPDDQHPWIIYRLDDIAGVLVCAVINNDVLKIRIDLVQDGIDTVQQQRTFIESGGDAGNFHGPSSLCLLWPSRSARSMSSISRNPLNFLETCHGETSNSFSVKVRQAQIARS